MDDCRNRRLSYRFMSALLAPTHQTHCCGRRSRLPFSSTNELRHQTVLHAIDHQDWVFISCESHECKCGRGKPSRFDFQWLDYKTMKWKWKWKWKSFKGRNNLNRLSSFWMRRNLRCVSFRNIRSLDFMLKIKVKIIRADTELTLIGIVKKSRIVWKLGGTLDNLLSIIQQ